MSTENAECAKMKSHPHSYTSQVWGHIHIKKKHKKNKKTTTTKTKQKQKQKKTPVLITEWRLPPIHTSTNTHDSLLEWTPESTCLQPPLFSHTCLHDD